MAIEAVELGAGMKNNTGTNVFHSIVTKEEEPSLEKLEAFRHFPQPVFLIDRQMNILEKNRQACFAVEKRWVGVSDNKLHFNNKENDDYARRLVAQLGRVKHESLHEKFALRSLDMVCRSFTVSSLSPTSSELVLTIQGDLSCTEHKMDSISRAYSLTTSETNIVKMMITGLKPKEIAYEIGISLNTVRSHLRTLYAKMQVRGYNDALTQTIRLLL